MSLTLLASGISFILMTGASFVACWAIDAIDEVI